MKWHKQHDKRRHQKGIGKKGSKLVLLKIFQYKQDQVEEEDVVKVKKKL